MEDEIWKDIYFKDFRTGEIIDYRGLYQVSNLGRVKSLNYRRIGKEEILKQLKQKRGYVLVSLSKNNKKRYFLVHRLVAHMFINNLENKPCVDHIVPINNGGTNNVNNLRWVTNKENSNNEYTIKHFQGENHPMYNKHQSEKTKEKIRKTIHENGSTKGKNNGRSVMVVQYNYYKKIINIFDYARQATELLGIDNSQIIKCCKGKLKSAGKDENGKPYYWKYYHDVDNNEIKSFLNNILEDDKYE